jgi:hypothetical protein
MSSALTLSETLGAAWVDVGVCVGSTLRDGRGVGVGGLEGQSVGVALGVPGAAVGGAGAPQPKMSNATASVATNRAFTLASLPVGRITSH